MDDRLDGTPPLSFDRLADIFDDQRALSPDAVPPLYRVFLDAASDGPMRIVEPGAGTGRIAIPALAAGHHVTAIDVAAAMLDVLERRLATMPEIASRCRLIAGDATALPLDDDSYDLGILAQMLYLIPDWERALDELFRVVRRGGEVMLVQERSTMSPALREWDSAWREAVEFVGYRHTPMQPDDADAIVALAERAEPVTEQHVASWSFGQAVSDADGAVERLRTLYESLDDAAWTSALARFGEWRQEHPAPGETWLGGTVDLVLVRGVVPDVQR